MFGFLKRRREEKAKEAARDQIRRADLRKKLHSTLESVLEWLIEEHHLNRDDIVDLEQRTDRIRKGIDLVLVDQMEWSDKRIPSELCGGAIIANDATSYSLVANHLHNDDLELLIGSPRDGLITGHMCFQLGFSRDGENRREDSI